MEEHTVDLLRECDSGCAMAAESLEQIRDFVSDQGLWNEITASYEKHQDLDLRIKKTLRAMEEQGKEPGKMASAWSWMSTEMRMMAKGGDKEAASIVTDGCNMGIKTICGYKNQYSGASKAAMELADELTGMEENLRDSCTEHDNPEAILIDRENVTALKKEMKKSLSSLENQVFQLYIAGNGYVEIAEILGKTPKAVDNALRRIRKKMKRCFGES